MLEVHKEPYDMLAPANAFRAATPPLDFIISITLLTGFFVLITLKAVVTWIQYLDYHSVTNLNSLDSLVSMTFDLFLL